MQYAIYAGVFAFIIIIISRSFKFNRIKRGLSEEFKKAAVVIDVRSVQEFSRGSRPGSLNIPLDQLKSKLSELNKSQPIILCCASGARSSAAEQLMRENGFNKVVNLGSWQNTQDL